MLVLYILIVGGFLLLNFSTLFDMFSYFPIFLGYWLIVAYPIFNMYKKMGKKYILELIPWSLFFSFFFLILPSFLSLVFSLGKKPNIWEDVTMYLLGSSISIFVSSAIMGIIISLKKEKIAKNTIFSIKSALIFVMKSFFITIVYSMVLQFFINFNLRRIANGYYSDIISNKGGKLNESNI